MDEWWAGVDIGLRRGKGDNCSSYKEEDTEEAHCMFEALI